MEVMQYPNNGELKEALMAGKDVTLQTHRVNGYGDDDSMKKKKKKVQKSIVEEEEEVLSGEEGHKSSVYLDDEDGGMWRCRGCVWAYQIGNPCMGDHSEGKPFHFRNGEASKTSDMMPSAEIGNVGELGRLVSAARSGSGGGGGAMEEEVIELEFFERAMDKLQTHNAYCPNCRSPISKVILRIKRETRPPIPDNKLDLLGCLACFRIFLPNKTVTHESTEDQQESDNASEGKCFDLLWFFGGTPKAQASQKQPSATIASDQGQKPNDGHLRGDNSAAAAINSPPPEMIDDDDAIKQDVKHEPLYYGKPSQEGGLSVKPKPEITQERNDGVKNQGGDVRVHIDDESPNKAGIGTGTGAGTSTQTQVDPPEERSSKSVEVVKSVVYGGLMESITSLSVVSSAAASGATTLNTVAIGVANLIGGSFVVAHNLLDLKINRPEDEYHKVLGQRNHFLLHAIVAMLSYLIFGLAPPVLYGFTFRQSDDRDLKLLGVAMASFACVLLLAIGKAYTSGANTFKHYFLTIVQYATAAATASGVAYAVGHLFQKLMDQLGWFNSTPTPTHALLLPNINSPNPNLAFY